MGFQKTNVDSLTLPKGVNLYRQTYDKSLLPDGIVVLKLNVFADDQGGWFKEVLRLDEEGRVLALKEISIDFKIRQSNLSYLGAHAKRFWHIHPDRKGRKGQDEVWTTNGTLLLGFIDLRKDSKTYNLKSKVVLSPDKAVYIPAGVAHGFVNPNNYPITLTYYTNQHFSVEDTQEFRVDPKGLPFDFVEPELM